MVGLCLLLGISDKSYHSAEQIAEHLFQVFGLAAVAAAKEPLERAAAHFSGEADALNEAADLLFPGWELPQEPSRVLNDKAASLLRTARDHYARGIDEVEAALAERRGACHLSRPMAAWALHSLHL